MDAVAAVLLLMLLLGWASLLFVTFFVIYRVIGGIGRGVAAMFRPHRAGGGGRRLNPGGAARVCPRPQCRKVEYRDAFYCSQCGAPLRGPVNDDKPVRT
jgi:hypothetical protein